MKTKKQIQKRMDEIKCEVALSNVLNLSVPFSALNVALECALLMIEFKNLKNELENKDNEW